MIFFHSVSKILIGISVKINWLFWPKKILSNFENETRFLSGKPKQKFEIVMPFDLCFLAGIFWQQGPPLVVVSSSSICSIHDRWNRGNPLSKFCQICWPYLNQGADYAHPTAHVLEIWICGCNLFYERELWASKSACAHSTKSLKINGCKRWCPKDLRIGAPAAPVLTLSLSYY